MRTVRRDEGSVDGRVGTRKVASGHFAGSTHILRRLERLPLSRVQIGLLFAGGLGYTFDAMDAAVIAFILPVVTALWSLSSAETGLLGSAVLIGYLFGAFLAGTMGDLIGRKRIMLYALAIYCIATLIAAASPTWEFLFVMRVLAGFGTGAESAIIAPFLSEFIPSKMRGVLVGSLAGFFSFGYVGAALLGRLVVPASDNGWRVVQVLTALPILMLLWWRRSIPESPRWLIERGRQAEAEEVVASLEHRVQRSIRGELPPPESVPMPELPERERGSFGRNLAALWTPTMARTTSMVWILWFAVTFAYYGFFTWIPSLLVKLGFNVTQSFDYSLFIYLAQIPGYYTAAFLSEKIDRKRTITLYLIGGAISAFLLANARDGTSITAAGVCLSFFMNGTYAGLYSYTPEVYPTAFRATGMGVASAVGRVGGIAAPLIIGFTFNAIGFGGVFGMTTAVLAAAALATLIVGLSTAGKTLEQIAAEELGARRTEARRPTIARARGA
jgi:MFS transporter, putative metabolite:H+ symporter